MTMIGKPFGYPRTKFCFVYCGPERCDCGGSDIAIGEVKPCLRGNDWCPVDCCTNKEQPTPETRGVELAPTEEKDNGKV